MKKITLLLFLALTVNLFSQEKIKGNGVVSTIKTDLTAFNKITINNEFKVTLIKSDIPAIEIETDENLHEFINSNVSDSIFTLQTSNKIRPKKTLNITIFCTKNLNEIELNHDAEIETLNTLNVATMLLKINDYSKANLSVKSDDFKLINTNKSKIQIRAKSKLNIESPIVDFSIGGSSNTHAIIKTDSLTINLKEKSTLEIEGNANLMSTTTKTSSNLKGRNLNVKKANITITDNSSIAIQAFEEITIESSGKSKLELYGNPKIILNKFTNSAKLYKKELNSK